MSAVKNLADLDQGKDYRMGNKVATKPAFRQCKVCGDKAGEHIHYGGRSCTSCRQFFRRCVLKTNR